MDPDLDPESRDFDPVLALSPDVALSADAELQAASLDELEAQIASTSSAPAPAPSAPKFGPPLSLIHCSCLRKGI